jgi:hypothetical protein
LWINGHISGVARYQQSPLPALAGFEFIPEDVASHDGSLSRLR